jgi:hypothetical protein
LQKNSYKVTHFVWYNEFSFFFAKLCEEVGWLSLRKSWLSTSVYALHGPHCNLFFMEVWEQSLAYAILGCLGWDSVTQQPQLHHPLETNYDSFVGPTTTDSPIWNLG